MSSLIITLVIQRLYCENMKFFALILVFVALASCAPQYKPQAPIKLASARDDYKHATILRYDNDNIGVDGYKYLIETSDGQSKEEQGQIVNAGSENESMVVHGQYSFVANDGVVYTVTYTADEYGFHPEGAHLPKSP